MLFWLRIGFAVLAAATSLASAAPSVGVAVCQVLAIDGDREGNFRRIEYALETARDTSAAIPAFPESVILGWENPDAHRRAEPIPGRDSDRVTALAIKYGLMIAIGLDEKDGDRLYDSAILVDKTGRILWKHRKLNVFAQLIEPRYTEGRPEGIGVVDTEYGCLSMLICADAFDDSYAERMASLTPDLMLIPYGWAAEMEKWPQQAKTLERLVARRVAQWKRPVVGTDLVGMMTYGPWKGQTFGGSSVVTDGTGTRQFSDEISADGYSDKASAAVTLARTPIGVCTS